LNNTLKSLWQNGYYQFASSKDGQTCPKKAVNLLCRGGEEQKVFQQPASFYRCLAARKAAVMK
jgi:hypothetical protein